MLRLLDHRGRFFGRLSAPDLVVGVVLFFLVFNSVSYAGGLVYAWLCEPELDGVAPNGLQLQMEPMRVSIKGKHLDRLDRRTKVVLRHESGRDWEALRVKRVNDRQMVLDLPEDLLSGNYSFIIMGSLPKERTMKDVLYIHPPPVVVKEPPFVPERLDVLESQPQPGVSPPPEVVDQGFEYVTIVCLLKDTRRPLLPLFYRASLKRRLRTVHQVLLSMSPAPKKKDGMLATLSLHAHKYTQGDRIFYFYQDQPLRFGAEIRLPPELGLREKLVSDPAMAPWEKR